MTSQLPVEILLVEDNPTDAELTLRALRKARLSNPIHHVEDGQAALDFLFAEGDYTAREGCAMPRLVLLDLKLPRVEGLEVLARIKGDPRTRDVPVVILTSSREAPDLEKAYSLGVNSYVVKPVEFEQFIDAVSQLGVYWIQINEAPE
jgi:two-component system response regulator